MRMFWLGVLTVIMAPGCQNENESGPLKDAVALSGESLWSEVCVRATRLAKAEGVAGIGTDRELEAALGDLTTFKTCTGGLRGLGGELADRVARCLGTAKDLSAASKCSELVTAAERFAAQGGLEVVYSLSPGHCGGRETMPADIGPALAKRFGAFGFFAES